MARDEDDPVTEVVWESPPSSSKNRFDWDVIAKSLREAPMVWGKVFDQDRTSVVNALRQGSIKALHPSLGFELRTRNNVREPIRLCTLYMRYNPDKDTSKRAHPDRKKD
jgi:hypothetical protein